MARPGPSNFRRMGRGPAKPNKFSKNHGPARPGPSFFQTSRPGPAAHHMAARPMKNGLYIGRPDNYVGRLMCCAVLRGSCAYADVFFRVNCWCFIVIPRPDSVGQPLSANETHTTSNHYSHISAWSDGFLWVTTSLCCCNARRRRSSSNIRYCCNTRYCNTRYRAKITPVQ